MYMDTNNTFFYTFFVLQSQAVLEGGMGFEGINPCGQTHGAEKLYPSGQTPTEILLGGNYTKVKNYLYFFIPLECKYLYVYLN
jgi:hypothetical protein